jgi:hypothetical protein
LVGGCAAGAAAWVDGVGAGAAAAALVAGCCCDGGAGVVASGAGAFVRDCAGGGAA